MKQAENKYLELMHAVLDGEASDREKAAFHAYLDANPEMRKTYDGLVRFADVLDQTGEAEPPADLSRDIMATLPPRRRPAPVLEKTRPWNTWFPVLKFGYAVAAGLVLGLVFGGVLFRNVSVPDTPDIYGVMSVKDHAGHSVGSNSLKVDAAGVKGTVLLKRSNSGGEIEFDLNSTQPAEAVLTFDGRYEFQGFTEQTKSVREFAANPGQVRLTFEGQNRSALLLAAETGTPVAVDLKILISGQPVYSGKF